MPMQVSVTAEHADPKLGERVIEENINDADAHRIAVRVHEGGGEIVTLTPFRWTDEGYVFDTTAAVEVGAKPESDAPAKKTKKAEETGDG